jgi:hypothetical protein
MLPTGGANIFSLGALGIRTDIFQPVYGLEVALLRGSSALNCPAGGAVSEPGAHRGFRTGRRKSSRFESVPLATRQREAVRSSFALADSYASWDDIRSRCFPQLLWIT